MKKVVKNIWVVISILGLLLIECSTKSEEDVESHNLLKIIASVLTVPQALKGDAQVEANDDHESTTAGTPFESNPPDEVVANNPFDDQSYGPGGGMGGGGGGGGTPPPVLVPDMKVEVNSVQYTNELIYSFNSVAIGQTSTKTLSITNTGDADLTITEIILTSVGNVFAKSGDPGLPVTITPTNSISFDISFSPTTYGSKTGTLKIQNNDDDQRAFHLYLKGTGAEEVIATIVKPETGVSRFENIVIEFSHSMNKDSVCSEASENGAGLVITNGGTQIKGRCKWPSYRQLIFDPYNALDSKVTYNVSMPNAKTYFNQNLQKVCLPSTNPCTGLSRSFVTEPGFEVAFSVDGFPLGANGLVRENPTNTSLPLNMSFSDNSLQSDADSIVLKKLDGTTIGNFATSSVTPVSGVNSYFLEITKGAKKYYRSFAFESGKTANDPSSAIAKAGSMTMGKNDDGLGQIGKLLEGLIKSNGNMAANSGNFRIDNRIFSHPDGIGHAPYGYMQYPTNTAPRDITVNGKTCKRHSDINGYPTTYIENLGPFCHFDACAIEFLGMCVARAYTDVYVKDIVIENTDLTGSADNRNVKVDLLPTDTNFEMKLWGKLLKGDLRVYVSEIDILGFIPGSALLGYYIYDVNFKMNTNCGSDGKDVNPCNYDIAQPFRYSFERTKLTVDSNGKLNINLVDPFASSANDPDFDIDAWSGTGGSPSEGAVRAYNARLVNGAWASWLINLLFDDVLLQLKWKIVQGVLRDTVQTVASNSLNAVFSQLRNDGSYDGIDVNLPDYLPDPFNTTKLNVGANIRSSGGQNVTKSQGLGVELDVSINASITNPNGTPPALHSGGNAKNSFVTFDSSLDSPPKIFNRLSTDSGVLLALRADAVNQAMYQLWKEGGFNLNLNQDFANTVKAYRGDEDRLFQIFQILLKASAITKVLAPGGGDIYYSSTEKINPSDDVEFQVTPLLPPVVNMAPLSVSKDEGGGKRYPLLNINFGDMLIEVVGKSNPASDCAIRPLPAGCYLMSTLRVNFRSKAGLNAHSFTSTINGGANNFQNVTAIQLNVCDDNLESPSTFDCDLMRTTNTDNDDLLYTVDVLDGPVYNPLGLNRNGIYEVLNPTIQKLIIPVLNYVLEELPLEKKDYTLVGTNTYYKADGTVDYTIAKTEDPNEPTNKIMANCGIQLKNLEVFPIPYTTNDNGNNNQINPYVLLRTTLDDYRFSGNCSL